jgi:hypothetical protein
LVQGVANLVVTSSIDLAGNDTVILAPGARLTIYMEGATASIKGNGFVNPGTSTNLLYYGLPANTSIDMSGNAAFNGLIYAPEADLHLGGGGNNSQDASGAFVVNTFTLNGKFNFHYDLNSRKVLFAGFVPVSWVEL